MRFVVALALAALAVLGPARTCPAAIPGLVGAGLPVLESCCPRPAQADAGDGRDAQLSSACCCSIEQRAPGAPAAPVRAAQERGAPVAIVARVAIAIAARPVTVVPAAPVLRAAAPPRTLFAQRVLLLS